MMTASGTGHRPSTCQTKNARNHRWAARSTVAAVWCRGSHSRCGVRALAPIQHNVLRVPDQRGLDDAEDDRDEDRCQQHEFDRGATALIEPAHQHHAGRWRAVLCRGRQRHRRWLKQIGLLSVEVPLRKQHERIRRRQRFQEVIELPMPVHANSFHAFIHGPPDTRVIGFELNRARR